MRSPNQPGSSASHGISVVGDRLGLRPSTPRFVARSTAFSRALERLEAFAEFDDTVLIEGESGTGKTQLARHVHARSARATKSYSSISLAELDDSLASSELFGHVSGAFTGAHGHRPGLFVAASGGTLFLDEIGKASATVQRKLLHAIERKEVRPVGADRTVRADVRLVAATNVPLVELVLAGSFLPDLMSRVAFLRVRIPPLRERRADLPELVRAAIESLAAGYGYGTAPDVAPELMAALCAAEWPGNLRELDATIRVLLISARRRVGSANVLTLDACVEDLAYLHTIADRGARALTSERVREALGQSGGKVAPAARRLGVSRATLHRHLAGAPELRERPSRFAASGEGFGHD